MSKKLLYYPCVVGDKIFVVNDENNNIEEYIVKELTYKSTIQKKEWQIEAISLDGKINISFYENNIGKTVFFTEEDAKSKPVRVSYPHVLNPKVEVNVFATINGEKKCAKTNLAVNNPSDMKEYHLILEMLNIKTGYILSNDEMIISYKNGNKETIKLSSEELRKIMFCHDRRYEIKFLEQHFKITELGYTSILGREVFILPF